MQFERLNSFAKSLSVLLQVFLDTKSVKVLKFCDKSDVASSDQTQHRSPLRSAAIHTSLHLPISLQHHSHSHHQHHQHRPHHRHHALLLQQPLPRLSLPTSTPRQRPRRAKRILRLLALQTDGQCRFRRTRDLLVCERDERVEEEGEGDFEEWESVWDWAEEGWDLFDFWGACGVGGLEVEGLRGGEQKATRIPMDHLSSHGHLRLTLPWLKGSVTEGMNEVSGGCKSYADNRGKRAGCA